MEIVWKLYGNRYVIEICNNGKIYKSDIELFFLKCWYLLLVCYD